MQNNENVNICLFIADLQDEFDEAWTNGEVNSSTWIPQASDKTVLAYKLLIQTGKADDPIDSGRIGCKVSSMPCERVCLFFYLFTSLNVCACNFNFEVVQLSILVFSKTVGMQF